MYSLTCKITLLSSILLNFMLYCDGFLPMLQEKTRNSLNAKGSSYYPHWYIQSDDSDNIDTCDLTANFCDTNCCGDKECKKYQKDAFKCPKNTPKDTSTEEQVDYECNYQSLEKRPWWLYFLCYVRNNSPFHVKFFEEDDIIKTLESMKEKIGETSQSKNKIRNYPYSEMENYLKDGYLNEDPILLKNTNDGGKERFFLLFPTNVLNSMFCVNVPLKYLEQRNADCLRLFSKQSCLEGNKELSLNDYLITNKSSGLLQKISINIPKTGISFQENFQLSDISHSVNCSKDGRQFLVASKYLRGEFPNSRDSINDTRDVNGSCNIENVRFMVKNEEKSLCENVLVGSRMKVIWNGTVISKIHISYQLADIPFSETDNKKLGNPGESVKNHKYFDAHLNNQDTTNHSGSDEMDGRKSVYNQKVIHYFVKQTFSVDYQHVPSNDSIEVRPGMQSYHSRDSNTTGYLIGGDIAPFIERTHHQHDLELDGSTDNGTAEETFGLWKRDSTGNCHGHVPIQFGLDTQTNCRINDEEIENIWDDCDLLRDYVARLQETIINSGAVSAGNSLNGTQIPILRKIPEEMTTTQISSLETNRTTNMTDADNSTDIAGNFTTPPSDAEPWLVLCDRIPAHLLIDIIYDGKVNRFGRHSVVGVHVDYLKETWTFDLSNATQKNLFTLKSSVKFHVYKPKSALPRFWELQMSPVYGATSLLNVFGIFSTDYYLYVNEKLVLSTMQLSLFVGFSIFLYSLRRYV